MKWQYNYVIILNEKDVYVFELRIFKYLNVKKLKKYDSVLLFNL